MASSSSSSPLTSQPFKYDVFLSFRGVDTRRNFTSHLYAALCRKDLQTFFDDHELKSGEEIAQSLRQAIQDSIVAVVVFSKDYASSSCCLDELAKIVERHQIHGQIIIPVFYEVDPSHLRKQSHDVAAAFVNHEQNPKNAHKIQRWRDALTTAANLSGFDSKNFSNDHKLIDKIIEVILEKLNQSMTCDNFEHLVGMESRIEEIRKALTIKPLEVCVLGIWGMGGLGKTTTAKVIFNMISHQFQGCCFIYNVRQRAEAGCTMKLQEELISKTLDEKELLKYKYSVGPGPFLIRRLGRKKMLIVLDDVDDSLQLESLIGDSCWFGPGSIILITSRNKQVFRGKADFIYEVKPLNYDEALQLFSKSAFKQKYPRNDYMFLSNLVVKYAQGNHLALKVLGLSLIGKRKKEWESALNQLSEVPNKDIQSVLQISYQGLNRVEKDVFLDIACFFNHVEHVDKDIVKQIYKSSRFDIDIVLSVLIDKCLVTSSLEMHDLLQEMGKEIVRQEAQHPSQRSRLWDPEDIYEVFVGNKEAETVQSIILDVSQIREIDLDPKVFMKIPNLKFINFYRSSKEKSNLHLFQGLDYLPNKIRYFGWNGYPLKSFPPNFHPEDLVVLELPNGKIKQFQKESKEENSVASLQTYGRLSMIINSFCSLFRVPSYTYSLLGKLMSLSLAKNKSITHLPNSRSGFLETLEVLDLAGCSNVNTFPEISSNIKELYLEGTAIERIPPSSVELLSKLEILDMRHCRQLKNLPSSFFYKLTSLNVLRFGMDSCLNELPQISEPMDNLKLLQSTETAMGKLSSSIGNLKGLNCLNPSPLNLKNVVEDLSALALLYISSLTFLSLSYCNLRESPEDLNFLSSVEELILCGNDSERIPITIKQHSQLKVLNVSYNKRLQSLPKLPSSVFEFDASDGGSLEQIWILKHVAPGSTERDGHSFCLWNCLKLDENECQAIARALLTNHLTTTTRNQMLTDFELRYPGSKIPEWVKYQSMGDFIQIRLPSDWFNCLFLGFAFYVCLDPAGDGFRFDCYIGDTYHFSCGDFDPESSYLSIVEKEHMMVFIRETFCEWIRQHGNFEEVVVIFKFSCDVKNTIKKCGVIPLYAQKDGEEFCEIFDFPTSEVSKLKRSTSAESFYCIPKKRLKMEEVE